MVTSKLTCSLCDSTVEIDESGDLAEPRDGSRGWYYSGQRDAWFCPPCNERKTGELLRRLLGLCEEKGVEVRDLRGRVLVPGRSATDNSEE